MKDGAALSQQVTEQRSLDDALRDVLTPDLSDTAHAERLFRLAVALTGATGGALVAAAPGLEGQSTTGPVDPQLVALGQQALDEETGEFRQRDRLAKRVEGGAVPFAIALRITGGGAPLAVGWERLTLLAELSRQRAAREKSGFGPEMISAAAKVAGGDWSAAQGFVDRLRVVSRADAVVLGAFDDRALARYVVSDAPALARAGAADDGLRDRLSALGRGEAVDGGMRLGSARDGYGIIILGDHADGDVLPALAPVFALPQARPRAIGKLRRWRAPLLVAAVLIGLVLLPVPDSVEAPATVTSEIRRTVTAPLSSILMDMSVAEGDRVSVGDVIASFDTRDIESTLSQDRAQLAATLAQLQEARRQRDEAKRRDAELEMDQIRARIDQYEELRDAAVLVAPVDGVVVRDHGERRIGASFPIGEPVAEIVGTGAPLIEVWVDERDRARISVGDKALFRSDADPDRDIAASITRIATIAEQQEDFTVFRVDLRPENPPAWSPGIKGVAAFDYRKTPVGSLAWTRLRHWLARNFWI